MLHECTRMASIRLPWISGKFPILQHIQHTYSEKGSDKYKDSWEVYCCPSVVLTFNTTLIHATEQDSQSHYQAIHKQKHNYCIAPYVNVHDIVHCTCIQLPCTWLAAYEVKLRRIFNTCEGNRPVSKACNKVLQWK